MAAKPPKQPTDLVRGSSKSNTNHSNNNATVSVIAEALDNHFDNSNINKFKKNHVNEHNLLDEVYQKEFPGKDCINENSKLKSAEEIKASCNCTNISIMHLFHEMKQEFPTIPDAIVTQCVNENCHQRENCISMLKKELDLNPIPMQTFPTKALQQQQQLQLQHQRHKPPTPLKPIRVAPQQPSNVVNGALNEASAIVPEKILFNKSVGSPLTSLKSAPNYCDSEKQNQKKSSKDVRYKTNSPNTCIYINNDSVQNNNSESDMSKVTSTSSNHSVNEMYEHCTSTTTPLTKTKVRVRPTTLNLYGGSHAQQHHRELNMQLQQRLQQRHFHQQEQEKPQQSTPQPLSSSLPTHKPLRKAPLPPLPPKPMHTPQLTAQLQQSGPNNIIISHTQQQTHHYNSHTNNNNQNNYSTDSATSSCLTSPISSTESEISANVSLSSPATTTSTPPTSAAAAVSAPPLALTAQYQPLKSPIRHRSVITLQPEPPYTRDFTTQPSPTINTPSSSNSPSAPTTPSSQKSYTSVNLTLRQPNLNSSLGPHSTIDISAGPAPNGSGAGLTYSSTSYDARRGYHKNLFITVTDEGGVFSASRIRSPRAEVNGSDAPLYENSDGGANGAADSITATVPTVAGVVSPRNFMQRQITTQHPTTSTAMPEIFPYPTQPTNHIVPSNYNSNHLHTNSIIDDSPSNHAEDNCSSQELDDSTEEILQLQKARRDKLATALRDNKNRLNHLGQEITILTEPVPQGESERLDRDIERLRSDITQMMNELENGRRFDASLNGLQQPQTTQQHLNSRTHLLSSQQQHTPQPFPCQRSQRFHQPSAELRLTSMMSSNLGTSGTPTTPAAQQYSSPVQQQQTPNLDFIQHHSPSQPPPTYQEYYQQYATQQPQQQHQLYQQQQQYLHQHQQQLQQQLQNNATNEEEYFSESDSLANDEDDDESLEKWSCNMCTFRNHPQLNICEACDNVRILPGMIRIVPSISNNNLNAASNNSMQHYVPTNRSNSNTSSSNMPNNNINNTSAASAVTSATLENDANLTQQQLQHFALHT